MDNQALQGQVAAITGGAQGIGLAIARSLHDRGATVWLLDIDHGAADEAARALGNRAHGAVGDVTDEASLIAARQRILEQDGRIDILVNNAGIYPPGTLREITTQAWDRVFDINCKGVFLASRVFMEPMIAAGYGRMVSIVTVDAYIPNIPVGRAGEPEDIAEVVAFLASPANRFVTGETVVASGGMTMV